MLSLAPYQFAGWLHHDQLFIFMFTLSCALTLWVLERPSYMRALLVAATWLITSLSRPAANLSGLLCLALLVLLVHTHRRAIVTGALVLLLALIGYGRWRSRAIAREGGVDYAGSQLFFTAYVLGGQEGLNLHTVGGPEIEEISSRLGTAAQQLVAREPEPVSWLNAYGFTADTERIAFPPEVFHKGAPSKQMVDFMFAHPTDDYYEFINFAVNDYALLGRAAMLSFRRHPLTYVAIGVSRSGMLVWKPGVVSGRLLDPRAPQAERQNLSFYFLDRNTADPQLALMPASYRTAFGPNRPNALKAFVRRTAMRLQLARLWAIADEWTSKALLLLFVAGLAVATRKAQTALMKTLLVIALPHFTIIGITGLIVGADYRYHFMSVPEAVVLGSLGLWALLAPSLNSAPRAAGPSRTL